MTSNVEPSIAIFGAGSWGTALAIHLAKLGRTVVLWGRNPDQLEIMNTTRFNSKYLSREPLPESILLTSDPKQAIVGASEIICMLPSVAFKQFLNLVQPYISEEQIIMWGCKGLVQNSNSLFFHDLVREKLGSSRKVVALSGPSFAQELAHGMPTAVVLASDDQSVLEQVLPRIHGDSLRCYFSHDLCGVQLCGTYKNILAVAAGISDGLGLGANARSALITRGLAEIIRLAVSLNLTTGTFYGLAGLGDIILSCTSDLSRNRRLGLGLGKGMKLADITQNMGMKTIESLNNVAVLLDLAKQYSIEMPIADQVQKVLASEVSPEFALQELLARDPKIEA